MDSEGRALVWRKIHNDSFQAITDDRNYDVYRYHDGVWYSDITIRGRTTVHSHETPEKAKAFCQSHADALAYKLVTGKEPK